MKEIGLSDALRYLFAGLVPLGLLYICDASLAKALMEDLGAAGVSLLAVVWGSLAYFVYRPLVYQRAIVRLQDACRRKSQSPRTYLVSRYCSTAYEASLLWAYIVHNEFRDHAPSWRREASGIHLMYMSSVTAIGFAVWRVVAADGAHAILMLVLGVAIGVGGFFHDRLAEDLEFRFCRSLGDDKLKEYATRFCTQREGKASGSTGNKT